VSRAVNVTPYWRGIRSISSSNSARSTPAVNSDAAAARIATTRTLPVSEIATG
jgi:hypothetical protein